MAFCIQYERGGTIGGQRWLVRAKIDIVFGAFRRAFHDGQDDALRLIGQKDRRAEGRTGVETGEPRNFLFRPVGRNVAQADIDSALTHEKLDTKCDEGSGLFPDRQIEGIEDRGAEIRHIPLQAKPDALTLHVITHQDA